MKSERGHKKVARILKTVREIEYDDIENASLIGQVYCEWYVREGPECSYAYDSSAYFYPVVVKIEEVTDSGIPRPNKSELRSLTKRLEKTLKQWRSKEELGINEIPDAFVRVVAEIIIKANDEVDTIARFFDKTFSQNCLAN
ncbi:unnamed protein product [Bursaphelenchus xylophilus]|uniref:(pine wood nematode) hypothetical protein n=1 Tax=Bursaphelenchus xylophilus TaxID=6326 RepID=A0A1I7RZU9_BURXY|nr:unnamed protein product [Bursaphelenchus xylophilus]CAG9109217.1 unnamed protein product [Bursaphelenchus xylophilus]